MTADQKRRLARIAVATLAILITIGQPRLTTAADGQPFGGATSTAVPDQSAAPIQSPTAAALACLDDYEGDGIAAMARVIQPGETQVHLFCPAADADWLRFFVDTARSYRLDATAASSEVDAYFYLFAPDGKTLLASTDVATAQDGRDQLAFAPPVAGWYFAQVKNSGDRGFPGLSYSVSLMQVSTASSATSTATLTATSTATYAPPPTSTPTSTSTAPPPAEMVAAAGTPLVPVVTATPVRADDLLRPQDGGASSGGLPVFDAGPTDALQPDKLEPDDSFAGAVALNVGAVYQHLNFVPAPGTDADGDFYSFRAKPGLCYQVQTGDLSPGLDTTILLWQAGATREERKLVAQNDDARPRTADLSSSVRWCSPGDGFMVAELHNYGWAPETDPRGKSYSLRLLIDPPTPTPTPTVRPANTGAAAPSGGAGDGAAGSTAGGNSANSGALVVPPAMPATATSTITPTPSATAAPATATVAPDAAATLTNAIISPSATVTTTATATATATPTPVPTAVADLTCYLDLNQNEGPDPGEGISGLRGVVIDTLTNAVIVEARSDANGHINLVWPGRASVRIALPDLGWNQEVAAGQLLRTRDEPSGGGHWSAEVRVKAPALPGILP